jgi:hypothetical protein
MRRLMLAFVVTAVLGFAVAAPALAAPGERNPNAFTGTLSCGSDSWDVLSSGTSWTLPWSPGDTPGQLMGGTLTITVGSEVVYQETFAPPAGLVDKLQTCRFERPLGDTYRVWDPAYVLFPAQ